MIFEMWYSCHDAEDFPGPRTALLISTLTLMPHREAFNTMDMYRSLMQKGYLTDKLVYLLPFRPRLTLSDLLQNQFLGIQVPSAGV